MVFGNWELNQNHISDKGCDLKIVIALNWVFDEKVKEFVKRVIDNTRSGGAWLESVASHLVGKLPERWSDDDVPVFIDQLRFMKIQYEEAEFLHIKNRALDENESIDTSHIEQEFDKLLSKMKLNDEEKQLAILRLYNKHVRKEEKN